MIFHPDEAIEMERRHILEGEVRVAHQEEIVSRLESRDNSSESVLRSRELLAMFRDFIKTAKERLAQLERHYPDKPPESN